MAGRSPSSSEEDVKATGIQKPQKEGLKQRGVSAAVEKTPSSPEVPESKKAERAHKAGKRAAPFLALPSFVTDPNNPIGWAVSGTQDFAADSIRLVRRCTKPDAREFKKIAYACAIGFLLMGFVGFIVKLVFIPINNTIVGG